MGASSKPPDVVAENHRILAALACVADYLHKGETIKALTVIDSLTNGDAILGEHLSESHATRLQQFGTVFNRWCTQQDLQAAWLARIPSKTHARGYSLQTGGHANICEYLAKVQKFVDGSY